MRYIVRYHDGSGSCEVTEIEAEKEFTWSAAGLYYFSDKQGVFQTFPIVGTTITRVLIEEKKVETKTEKVKIENITGN